ncbi:MAG: TauD/TfdA family dioxygenase [Rhodospirillales bacterium]|nr:TauD/TfdA family dioxygenase [Rhodospirillales bacterium]
MDRLNLHPATGPAVWSADDLRRDRSWIFRFTAVEIAELEAAVKKIRGAGKALYGFGRDDFPLPHLAERLAACAHDLETGRGVALWRGLNVDAYDEQSLKTLYWGIGVHLGVPISQNSKGQLIGHVRDGGGDYMSKNVRGYTTQARLAPHCDSSDLVALLCVHPSKSGGESLIASSAAIYNRLLDAHPDYLEPLLVGFHFDLRGEGATADPDEVTRAKVPVFSWHEGWLSCRYNGKTIVDGQIKAGQPLTGDVLKAVALVGELAMQDGFRYPMEFERGDIQVLNNHAVLHSRTAFEDWPEPERKRNLLRMWINQRAGIARPLAPQFADRMNTGPRGGVRVITGGK